MVAALKICNGICIFSFLAFFQITVLVLAIFLAIFSTGFIPFIN